MSSRSRSELRAASFTQVSLFSFEDLPLGAQHSFSWQLRSAIRSVDVSNKLFLKGQELFVRNWFRLTFPIILAHLGLLHASRAESTREALAQFGLIGTWSTDCAKDLDVDGGYRATYSAPFAGPAMLHSVTKTPLGSTLTIEAKIESAVRATETKIKMVELPLYIRATRESQPVEARADYRVLSVVIERIGPEIRTIDTRTIDGAVVNAENGIIKLNGLPNPLLEKCLN